MPETSLNTAQLSHVFHAYSPNELTKTERNKEAFANDVYDVTDSGGQRYVLRILKTQKPENVALEAEMQKRLEAAGIGTPQYIEISPGSYVGEHEGTRFTLSKFIAGTTPKHASLDLIQDVGAVLAKLHDCLQGVTIPPSDMQWLNPGNAQKDLAEYEGPLKDDLTFLVNSGLKIFDIGLPTAVTHGDLWLGNIFAKGNKVTAVFDLETAEDTVRIVDLARTYSSLQFNTQFTANDIINKLFVGYNSQANSPLTTVETDNFKLAAGYAAGVCATWNALHGNRYADPYIAVGKQILTA